MKMTLHNRQGGISVFLSIIITSIILVLTVLLDITNLKSEELLIKSALVQQQDLLLSQYSEIFEDRYGLFATSLTDDMKSEYFETIKGINGVNNYFVHGIGELSGDNLYNEISDFTKPRLPIHSVVGILGRINFFRNTITSITVEPTNKISDLEQDYDSNLPSETILDSENMSNFDFILELIKCLRGDQIEAYEETTSWSSELSMSEIDTMLDAYEADIIYENSISKIIKSELSISDNILNEISGFIEKIYQINTGTIYERMCFEYYVWNMFSCKTNYTKIGGISTYRKDLRNRDFSEIPFSNTGEIERIIFGSEDNKTNDFFAKASIEGIRFVCNLISNLADSKKRESIKTAAASISGVILLVSLGNIAIPPEAIEAVILVVKSTWQAISDYKKLIDGEFVSLLNIEGTIKLETIYADYVNIMLLAVPLDIKLGRIESIMKLNTNLTGSLFTGLSVSCTYEGNLYICENNYHEIIQ